MAPIGWFAPLPPQRTGVADYAAQVGGALRRAGIALLDNPWQMAEQELALPIYHFGNNALHQQIFARAQRQPGLVVLHDAVLHHVLVHQLSEAEYVEEFAWHYGEWNRGLAAQLYGRRAQAASQEVYFRYPFLRRRLAGAKGVIVHNRAAAGRVRAEAGALPIFEIPHLVPEMVDGQAVGRQYGDRAEVRRRWNIPEDAFVIGLFGYLRPAKRVGSLLRAFFQLAEWQRQSGGRPLRLLLAGPAEPSALDEQIRRAAEGEPRIVRAPYLEEPEWSQLAGACDLGVNLRYPSVGESSGITAKLLSLGRPVLVTEGEENAGLPLAACPRVPAGPGEEEALVLYARYFATHPDAGQAAQRAAAEYAAQASPQRTAEAYRAAITAVLTEAGGRGEATASPSDSGPATNR